MLSSNRRLSLAILVWIWPSVKATVRSFPTHGRGADFLLCLPRLQIDLDPRSGRTIFTMPNGSNIGDASGPTPFLRQPDPQVFAGTPDIDVIDWLKYYERASTHNRWDNTIKVANVVFFLANVVFFLKDTASQWLKNHREQITSWDDFTVGVKQNLGQTDTR